MAVYVHVHSSIIVLSPHHVYYIYIQHALLHAWMPPHVHACMQLCFHMCTPAGSARYKGPDWGDTTSAGAKSCKSNFGQLTDTGIQ